MVAVKAISKILPGCLPVPSFLFIVEKKHPVIQKLLLNISNEKGCYFSRMTGSGSACYGLFRDKRSSKVALKRLRKKYPKFWFSIAKTI